VAIRIGCGSWADAEYVGVLYPKGLPPAERLRVYATRFERVELNNTYYSTPTGGQMAGWAAQTPQGFLFDFKLHRAFSQKPATSGVLVTKLADAVKPLMKSGKLGCFLLTLAPSFGPDRHRLEELDALMANLPKRPPLAVELRHRGWVEGKAKAATLGFFRERKLAWVALDLPKLKLPALLPPIDEVTHPRLAYMRLHGRNPGWAKAKSAAERHQWDYAPKELEEIAARIRKLAEQAEHVHVSVNNHAEDFAPKAALALQALLTGK
jgi:uncharacterized protein YecE (DUF72 family)